MASTIIPAAPAMHSRHVRALLVYTSVHHQNTAKVAHEIVGVLGAECAAPGECPYSRLASCDLLGIGSGIYYGRPHDELLQWVHGLPDTLGRVLPAFIFTTSGLPFLARFWHRPLKHALASRGFKLVGEFACRGFDTWGPLWLTGGLNWRHPNERDFQRAREFARGVQAAILASPQAAPRHGLSPPGRLTAPR